MLSAYHIAGGNAIENPQGTSYNSSSRRPESAVNQEREEALMMEILKLTRLRLQTKLPAMSSAIVLPEWKVCWEKQCGTDGSFLYWNPKDVFCWFQKSSVAAERQYLHLILHCLYLHPFRKYGMPSSAWNLACDIMTEYRIDRMSVQGFQRPVPAERSRWYRKWTEQKVPFWERSIAEWIWKNSTRKECEELKAIFSADDHSRWPSLEEEKEQSFRYEKLPDKIESLRLQTQAVHQWRTIYEELPVREKEHKRQAGGSAGQEAEVMVPEYERQYDYRNFLRRYAMWGEELEADMDSFDYLPYYYSRTRYECLLLLEPLEYREVQKLQEFVIAIDTSGSCSGVIVRQFLRETLSILEEHENFFSKMNVHILQCDCVIQEHVKITCQEEWKRYLEQLEIKGHGDTDFTPVFRLVDNLVKEGEFRNLKGLFYFTDGDGIYPDQEPAYETAFVFLNQSLKKGTTPDWAYDLNLGLEMEAE